MTAVNKPFDIGTRPQLLLDESLISCQRGFTQQLHAVTKHPEPVLAPEAPWELPGRGALWGPLHVERRDGEFKLFYHTYGTYPGHGKESEPRYRCVATSKDGVHFERPELGVFEHDGSTKNNIIALQENLGGQGHGWLDGAAIDPSEPEAYRFKSVYWTGKDEQKVGGHGVAFSEDGLHWRAWAGNPLVTGRDSGDVVTCATSRDWFNPANSAPQPPFKYVMFPKTHVIVNGTRRRSIAVCASNDDPNAPPFTKLFDRQLALAPDALDDDMAEDRLAAAKSILTYDHPDDHQCEFYGMFVFRCGDLFLGMLWIYDVAYELSRLDGRNQYALVDVQLAASRDLFHWQRVGGRQPIIPRGAADTFDSHMIFYHSLPVEAGDEWWIYYVGQNEGHAVRNAFTSEMREQFWADVQAGKRFLPSIGLGKVRKEGFVSLDAGDAEAELVTRPMKVGGESLYLNAAVAEGGDVRVEVRDVTGKALPGFEAAACEVVTGDGVRLTVTWTGWPDRRVWLREPVRLVIRARRARVYGFVFGEGG